VLISVDEIKEAGLVLDLEEPLEAFPVLGDVAEGGFCRFVGPVAIHVRVFQVHEMVEVEGQATTRAVFTCSRCLKDFESPISANFALTYCRELPEVEVEDDEEGVELSAEDMGLILFEGQEIDLAEGIQEQLVMALPLRPVCDEACKGLCPQCGADLNAAPCDCRPQDLNIKMAALKDFKVKKQ
jgi:uncharacterized protein